MEHQWEILLWISEAVDVSYRAVDDGIAPCHQGLGGRQAHLLYVFVDRTVLVDEGVGALNVGLRLVVVVVRDERLDRIVREKLLELAVQLRRQGLVRRRSEERRVGKECVST